MKASPALDYCGVVLALFAMVIMMPAIASGDPKDAEKEAGVQVAIKAYVVSGDAEMIPEAVSDTAKEKKNGQGTAAVLSEDEGNALLAALKRRVVDGEAEFRAAPRLVTRSGQRAKVEMIREMIYPTEYDPPEIPGNLDLEEFQKNTASGGVFPVTPANPTAFETRNVGLTFEYDPTVLAGDRISLLMALEDVRFGGFVNYGSPVKTTVTNKKGKNLEVILTDNRIVMPVFSVRKMTSSVELEDGGWVFLGGLPESEEGALTKEIEAHSKEAGPVEIQEASGPIFYLIQASIVDRAGN